MHTATVAEVLRTPRFNQRLTQAQILTVVCRCSPPPYTEEGKEVWYFKATYQQQPEVRTPNRP